MQIVPCKKFLHHPNKVQPISRNSFAFCSSVSSLTPNFFPKQLRHRKRVAPRLISFFVSAISTLCSARWHCIHSGIVLHQMAEEQAAVMGLDVRIERILLRPQMLAGENVRHVQRNAAVTGSPMSAISQCTSASASERLA